MGTVLTKKISFWLVVALLLGWGALGLLLIQSSKELLQAQLTYDGNATSLPRGVSLQLQVDKNVYGANETVLISLRNDSRKDVWLAERANGCNGTWWELEQLTNSETWTPVAIQRQDCVDLTYGLNAFARHSVKTDSWNGLIQTDALGSTFAPAPTGTYRIAVPFLHGQDPSESDWLASDAVAAVSSAFTYGAENPDTSS